MPPRGMKKVMWSGVWNIYAVRFLPLRRILRASGRRTTIYNSACWNSTPDLAARDQQAPLPGWRQSAQDYMPIPAAWSVLQQKITGSTNMLPFLTEPTGILYPITWSALWYL